ncbi:MAG: N utilization substance protein B [Cocleimonas sp.]|jgi:N utilization substance protein B
MPVDKKSQYISERRVARKLAVIAIYQWQMTQNNYHEIYLGLQEDKDLSKDMSKADMSYFQSLCKTVVENVDEIDAVLNPFLDRNAEHLDQIERAVLRMATCELKNHPEVPYKVAVNEAVNICKKFGADQAHKFVNGVLDEVGAKLRPEESGQKEPRKQKQSQTKESKVKISSTKDVPTKDDLDKASASKTKSKKLTPADLKSKISSTAKK